MRIMDWIMDQIATAWELLGLIFLSGSADPALLRRWESELEDREADTEHNGYPQGVRQAHCA